MKSLLLVVLFSITLVLTACIALQNREGTDDRAVSGISGQIISLEQGGELSFTELIERLSKADYVLLGEVHDDPTHHALQHIILEELVKAGCRPAVVFEMFNREDAGAIASVYRKYPYEPDRIAEIVAWDRSGWPDWRMYRPIVKTAMDAELPVIAGNLSRQQARQVVMQGMSAIDARTVAQMGLLEPLPEEKEYLLRGKIIINYGGMLPSSMVSGMVTAQRLRDATLADAMIAQNRGDGAVLIAGSEHARTDYGVPFYLRYREPNARIASLAFVKSSLTIDEADKTPDGRPYDFTWVLPQTAGKQIAHP